MRNVNEHAASIDQAVPVVIKFLIDLDFIQPQKTVNDLPSSDHEQSVVDWVNVKRVNEIKSSVRMRSCHENSVEEYVKHNPHWEEG